MTEDKTSNIFFIALIALFSLYFISCLCYKKEGYNSYARKGEKCGEKNGGMFCDEKLCCSIEGICGTTHKDCEERGNRINILYSDRGVLSSNSKWRLTSRGNPEEEVQWVLRDDPSVKTPIVTVRAKKPSLKGEKCDKNTRCDRGLVCHNNQCYDANANQGDLCVKNKIKCSSGLSCINDKCIKKKRNWWRFW